MIQIPLTKGYIALIDDCDADLADYKWSAQDSGSPRIYAVRKNKTLDGKWRLSPLHRTILERIIDRSIQRGEICDHANGNSLDNTRTNLRLCSYSQNLANTGKPKTNSSGFKGVTFNKNAGRYTAQIKVNQKLIYLGLFDTPEAAAHAYNEAAIKHFGEFARLNEIPQSQSEPLDTKE